MIHWRIYAQYTYTELAHTLTYSAFSVVAIIVLKRLLFIYVCIYVSFFYHRNVVRSCFGVRVIELRKTSGGMVVGSKQFPGSRPPLEALVPPAPPHCLTALTLVAEDSTGNVLKYPLPTAF